MSSFSFGQIAQLVRSFEVAGYTPDHLTGLGQLGGEGHLLIIAFLEGRAKIEVVGFDPSTFIGKGWRFAGVPAPAKIRSVEDVRKINLFSPLRSEERVVSGEETLRRLAAGIALGAKDFCFLWNHQEVIPEGWKGVGVFFDADVLLNPGGGRYSLYLYWSGEGWRWSVRWLDHGRGSDFPSAVLTT